MKCDLCGRCSSAHTTCILGHGSESASIMIVLDSPSEHDDAQGSIFTSRACNAVLKSMVRRNIDIDDVYYTAITKCYGPDPTQKEASVCSQYLDAEIQVVDPDIIVPMGNRALKYCLGKVGITKSRGNAQIATVAGRERIIMPMLSPDMTDAKPIYRDYILSDLDTLAELYTSGMSEPTNNSYHSLDTLDEVISWCDRYHNAEMLAFDIETTSLSPYMPDSKIICISLSDQENTGVVIPLYHHESPYLHPDDGTQGLVVKLLRDLLEDASVPKVAHNGKFDIEWLRYWLDIDVANFCFDTMLAHYLCVSEERGTQGLKSQAWEYTDMGGYDNELDEYRSKLPEADRYNYDNIPWEILSKYAAADADVCLRLYHVYKPMIDANPKWTTIMNDIMMPGSYALRDVEGNGMQFDFSLSAHYQQTYGAEIDRIQQRLQSYPEVVQIEREKQQLWAEREAIRKIPRRDRTEEEQRKFTEYKRYDGYRFNFSSTAQLRELLFDRLGLTTSVTTAKGELSTGEEAMNELAQQHEIPSLLLELRKVNTLNNMFIEKLPGMVDPTGRIHPTFNMVGTVTGRLASENPNAQQFPRKSEDPMSFQYCNEPKALFSSRFGDEGCILNADYAALEMRVAAIISRDEHLTHAIQSGADLHKSTASLVWGVPVDEVPKDMRTRAKAVNFGIIYGKSGITFARDLYYDPSGKDPKKTSDWEKAKAEGIKLVDDYLRTFSGLDKWINDTKAFAHKNGYVETMFGRRRRLPDLNSKVPTLQANAERQAINAPIQGTGSDFTMLSIINIQKYLTEHHMRSVMICTVHDSIVFDVYIPELPIVATVAKAIMESVHKGYIDTPVPIRSDLELGASYGATFDVSLEECQSISDVDSFNEWNHRNKMVKYTKEIQTLHDRGLDYRQLLDWMVKNGRPVSELSSTIVEVYTNDGSDENS